MLIAASFYSESVHCFSRGDGCSEILVPPASIGGPRLSWRENPIASQMRLGEDCRARKEDYGAHGGLQRWTLRGDQMEMVKRCLRTKTQGMWFHNWMHILNNSMFRHTCRLLWSAASCSQASHGCEAVDSLRWGKKGCKEVTKFWGFQVIFFLWKRKLEGSSWPVNWSSPN